MPRRLHLHLLLIFMALGAGCAPEPLRSSQIEEPELRLVEARFKKIVHDAHRDSSLSWHSGWFGNFLVNSFAWEVPGITSYLVGPLSARQLILGKNLGVLIFQSLLLLECTVIWSLVRGLPDLTTLLNGVLVFASGILVLTATGNFVSIAFPVRRSISSITNSSSQLGTVVTFAAMAVTALLAGSLLVLGLAIGGGPAQVVLLALLVTTLAGVNVLLLGPAADLFENRLERLVEALEGGGSDGA